MNERFEFRSFNQTIFDNLTGENYHTLSKITKLLNQEDERANKNAERFDEYMYEYYAMKSTLKRYDVLMEKYGIISFEELENIINDCFDGC